LREMVRQAAAGIVALYAPAGSQGEISRDSDK